MPQLRETAVVEMSIRLNQLYDQWDGPPNGALFGEVNKAFDDALNRMQMPGAKKLSPNAIGKEKGAFNATTDFTHIRLTALEIDRDKGRSLDPERFDKLLDYLNSLHAKLGDYSEMPTAQ